MRLGLIFATFVSPLLAYAKPSTKAIDDLSNSAQPVTILGVLAVLSLVPFAFVMLTSFSKIAVVLSLARSAMGTQQAPPSIVLTGLAAVLTGHIMAPVFTQMYELGSQSFGRLKGDTQVIEAVMRVAKPMRDFLVKHTSPEEKARFLELAQEMRNEREASLVTENDLAVIVPAFVITELKEAFQIGFLVFLPFLVLDMLIANVLLALGMQTLSPSQVSLPFKILLFVAVDGWGLLASGIIQGYR